MKDYGIHFLADFYFLIIFGIFKLSSKFMNFMKILKIYWSSSMAVVFYC